MMPRHLRVLQIGFALLFLAGCSSLAPLLAPPTPVPSPQATSTPQATPTATPTAAVSQPRLLRVWLPPQFDPQADNPSAELLRARLQAFQQEYPGIQLEIRIKSDADILRTLTITNNAAPAALPDLIALSYWNMQKAASGGFLHPLEGLTSLLQDPDWYAFARELAHLKNVEYGIPFGSDVLVMVYRPSMFAEPPSTWEDVFASGVSLAFPASSPTALFPLSLYLSENLDLTDDRGSILPDEDALVSLFSFYKRAIESGIIPPPVRDQQTDLQSIQFYRNGQSHLAVVWLSSDLQARSGNYLPLPGLSNAQYSLGNGWVWALAGSDVENQPLAVELASYLVESRFMSEWTRAAGILPTRPQALTGWEEDLRVPLHEALQSAHPLPAEDSVSVVGPLLQGALIRLFNGEQPEVVARSVMDELK